MYFHRKVSGTGGKTLQLLESYRTASGPRHRVVVSLGGVDMPKAWDKAMAMAVESRLSGGLGLSIGALPEAALELFNLVMAKIESRAGVEPPDVSATGMEPSKPPQVLEKAPSPAHEGSRPEERSGRGTTPENSIVGVEGVVVDGVSHSHGTPLGVFLLGLEAWEALDMDTALLEAGLSRRQVLACQALILGRMAEPMSEHALHGHLSRTSLPDLLGADVLNLSLDSLYRAGDVLLGVSGRLEAHLRSAMPKALGTSRTMLLYDLTNSHFEGACLGNAHAKRGKNKQKRDDCPQVVVGVVFDENGFVVCHKVFQGNQHDGKSLPAMAEAMRSAVSADGGLPIDPPTVVVDGGIGSEENVALLAEAGFNYIVHDRRPARTAWEAEFAEGGFAPVPGRADDDKVEVKSLVCPGGPGGAEERVLLCRSEGRKNKEAAIFSRAEEKLIGDLDKLARRAAKHKPSPPDWLNQAIGRLRERHPRAARFYDIAIEPTDGGRHALSYQRNSDAEADGLCGCYALRTNRMDLTDARLWSLYMTLATAEDGFRSLKGDLGLRPIYHQTAERVESHILQTVVAYQLVQFNLHKLREAGDRRSWTTIRRVLSTHCYATIHLPRPDGSVITLRRPGMPDPCQAAIYGATGARPMAALPSSRIDSQPPGRARRAADGNRKIVVTKKLDC